MLLQGQSQDPGYVRMVHMPFERSIDAHHLASSNHTQLLYLSGGANRGGGAKSTALLSGCAPGGLS